MSIHFVFDVKSECSSAAPVDLAIGPDATAVASPLTDAPSGNTIAAEHVRVRIKNGKIGVALVALESVPPGSYTGSVQLADSAGGTQTVSLLAECRNALWWS